MENWGAQNQKKKTCVKNSFGLEASLKSASSNASQRDRSLKKAFVCTPFGRQGDTRKNQVSRITKLRNPYVEGERANIHDCDPIDKPRHFRLIRGDSRDVRVT